MPRYTHTKYALTNISTHTGMYYVFTNVHTLTHKPTIQQMYLHTGLTKIHVYVHIQARTDISMHTNTRTSPYRSTHTHTEWERKPDTNTKVTRTDEHYELRGLPDLHFLPALVSQKLSRLLERLCEAGEELRRPRGFMR